LPNSQRAKAPMPSLSLWICSKQDLSGRRASWLQTFWRMPSADPEIIFWCLRSPNAFALEAPADTSKRFLMFRDAPQAWEARTCIKAKTMLRFLASSLSGHLFRPEKPRKPVSLSRTYGNEDSWRLAGLLLCWRLQLWNLFSVSASGPSSFKDGQRWTIILLNARQYKSESCVERML
jgi:hypothetical protein